MNDEARNSIYKNRKSLFTKKLRQTMTPTETLLWNKLRNRGFKGIKFRRQVNIGPYIADFLCKQHRLIIEIDGSIHVDQKEYDQERDLYLSDRGYHVVRNSTTEVLGDIDSILQLISNSIFSKQSSPSPVRSEKN